MKRIVFYGSIGVGKTTAGRELALLNKQICFVEEDLTGNVFLADFYNDMKKYAFASSVEMLSIMAENNCKQDDKKSIMIVDQGVEELICYNRMELKKGILTEQEFGVYQKLYNAVLRGIPKTDLYVYFYCDKKEQLKRIVKRGRPFERHIDGNFLNDLNMEYEKFTAQLPAHSVLKVNTDKPIEYKWLAKEIKARVSIL